jgi:hypothetical protein
MAYVPGDPAKARCPPDLVLEEYLLHRTSRPCARHVEACAACQHRLTCMEAQARHFLEQVYPSTVNRIELAALHSRDTARVRRRRTGSGRPAGGRGVR